MKQKSATNSAEYILPLNMDGLSGRMLRLPAPTPRKKRELLIIPGHHTSIERMIGLAEYINQYGAVTMPDLPGFGGMESFYKIGEKPTIDNLADYLAAFIKLRYRDRRFSILAISFGFAVTTRMLQKYPEIAKKVDLVVSWVGLVHKDDFRWNKRTVGLLKNGSWILSQRLPSAFARYCLLRGPLIRATYSLVEGRHPKFKNLADEKERDKRIDFEIVLWKINDIRTYLECTYRMFSLDLCNSHVNLPVYHVAVKDDHYFDNVLVEQHMRTIFKDFHLIETRMPVHAPTVIATKDEVEAFVPPKLRKALRKKV
jgi:pimeloyl-ACP methyl ester carboxylesterase